MELTDRIAPTWQIIANKADITAQISEHFVSQRLFVQHVTGELLSNRPLRTLGPSTVLSGEGDTKSSSSLIV